MVPYPLLIYAQSALFWIRIQVRLNESLESLPNCRFMSKKMAALKKIAVPIDSASVGPSNAIESYKQRRLHLQPPADKSILKWQQKKILLVLLWIVTVGCKAEGVGLHRQNMEKVGEAPQSHSCIHDHILKQRRRFGPKEYFVTPHTYGDESGFVESHRKCRELLAVASKNLQLNKKQPIRIFLNYDEVGHPLDRDCRNIGDIVKLGELPVRSIPGVPACDPYAEQPVYGDCWYKCTSEDISREDKKMTP